MLKRDQIRTLLVAVVIVIASVASAYYIHQKEAELNAYVEHFKSTSEDNFVWGTQQLRVELAAVRQGISAYGDTYAKWDVSKAQVSADILFSRFETVTFAINNMEDKHKVDLLMNGSFTDLRSSYEQLDTQLIQFLQTPSPKGYGEVLHSIDTTAQIAADFASEALHSSQRHGHQIRAEMLARAQDYKTSLLLMLGGSALLIILIWLANWKISAVNKSLEKAVERAEEAARAKALFLSSMSHEFRTPLNAISGYTQLILMNLSQKEQKTFQGYAEAIDQSINNLVDLVDQVLELDHLLHRDESLILDHVDAREMVKNAIKLSARHAFSKQVTVHQKFDLAPCMIETDSGMFTQVLTGLISNAVKFNHNQGEVWISCFENQGEVAITVKDNGIGIPRDKESLLFLPFERLGREAGIISGGGTGLSICKQICDRLGLQLGYEQRQPEGCSFWLRAPSQFSTKLNSQFDSLISARPQKVMPSNENRQAN